MPIHKKIRGLGAPSQWGVLSKVGAMKRRVSIGGTKSLNLNDRELNPSGMMNTLRLGSINNHGDSQWILVFTGYKKELMWIM
jgi:hypothetical protein